MVSKLNTVPNYEDLFRLYYNKKDTNINDIVELLKIFEKYLVSIYKPLHWFSDNKKNRESYNVIINTLIKYMNIVYNYYDKIPITRISHNIDINYKFIDTMTIAIIILYSYIYQYNISSIEKHKTDEPIIQNKYSTLSYMMYRIIINCYKIYIMPKKEQLLFKFKEIIYNNEPKCYIFVKQQISLVIDFIRKIKKFNEIKPSNERYITIPKYTGICWFISFIVGICYSDKNKKLLLHNKKINEINNKQNENISKLSANEIFTTLIYKIIYQITEKNKTYNNIDKKTIDELNIYLKETPIKFLIKLVNEYFESSNKKEFEEEYSFINDYILKKNYKTPYTLNDYNKLGDFGMQQYNYFFLNILYKFLNINSLYLLKAKSKFYTYKSENKNPDIIIINKTSNEFTGERFMESHIINSKIAGYSNVKYEDITKDIVYTPQSITYNNNNYELDYILYGSDYQNSWKNTGHAIVALNYNNKEYFYDSRYYINEYIYNGHKLRYPCPLLEKEWKKDFSSSNNKFCVKKCFHSEIEERSAFYLDAKELTEENICYTKNTDIVCCYVKVKTKHIIKEPIIKTDNMVEFIYKTKKYKHDIYINTKNEKYIKFNKEYTINNNKVVFIYKNKKYKRNIYINTKNKKYIKLNKEFILLSTS